MRALSLAREVAEASRVLDSELPAKSTRPKDVNNVVASARALARLQAKRAKLRKELKRVEQDIRHERKMLRALAGITR